MKTTFMKEYEMPIMEGGVQLQVIVVARYKKYAAKAFDCSLHHLNEYANIFEPRTEIAIKNPYQKFAYFNSGWLREKKPEWFLKVMPYHLLADYIKKCNKRTWDKMFEDMKPKK